MNLKFAPKQNNPQAIPHEVANQKHLKTYLKYDRSPPTPFLQKQIVQSMAKKDAKQPKEETEASSSEEIEKKDEYPPHNDRILVEICRNSEYITHVRELAQVLETFYPHLDGHIECVHYELPQWKVRASWLFGILPFLGFLFLLGGEYLLDYVNMPQGHDVLELMRENRLFSLLFMLFLGSISQYLVTPAAFEIYYNDELVFSKLNEGRWCTTEELLALLKAKGLKKIDKKSD
ncbi:unnamed protein product [Aphanomyces euteiches]